MFISVSFDLMGPDTKNNVADLLKQYGVEKVHENLYETFDFPLKSLGNFKRDIAELLDMDDKLRIYQYPLDNTFKISYLKERKWKRLSVKGV